MITQSYDRRRRVASRVPLAPSPTTPEFLAEEARKTCRLVMHVRRVENYWRGFNNMAAANRKAERLNYEDEVVVVANTLIKMNRGLA